MIPNRLKRCCWTGGLVILAGAVSVSLGLYVREHRALRRQVARVIDPNLPPERIVTALSHWIYETSHSKRNDGFFLIPALRATPLHVLRGGGDCADKSRLLSAMLQSIGIPAGPVMLFAPGALPPIQSSDVPRDAPSPGPPDLGRAPDIRRAPDTRRAQDTRRATNTPRATHTVVEARIGPGRSMVADPSFDLCFPRDGGPAYADLNDLRRDPDILTRRLTELKRTAPWPAKVFFYRADLSSYRGASTINWRRNAVTRAVFDAFEPFVDPPMETMPRPIWLEDPHLSVAAVAGALWIVLAGGLSWVRVRSTRAARLSTRAPRPSTRAPQPSADRAPTRSQSDAPASHPPSDANDTKSPRPSAKPIRLGPAGWLLYRLARLAARRRPTETQMMRRPEYRRWRFDELQGQLLRHFDASAVAGHDVVDFGCGSGELCRILAGLAPRRLTALDADAGALARIDRPIILPTSHRPVRFQHCPDARRIPLPDACADLICCFDVVEHIAHPAAILNEWRRVLRSGGRVWIWWSAWRGPYGHHLRALIPIPWVHLFLPQSTLIRVCARRYEDPDYRPRVWDLDPQTGRRKPNKWRNMTSLSPFLNRLTRRQFERIVRRAGLNIQRRETRAVNASRWRWLTRTLLPVPWVGDCFVSFYIYELSHPGRLQPEPDRTGPTVEANLSDVCTQNRTPHDVANASPPPSRGLQPARMSATERCSDPDHPATDSLIPSGTDRRIRTDADPR